jgi:hypothetical protein
MSQRVLNPIAHRELIICAQGLLLIPFVGFFPDILNRFDKNVPTLRRTVVGRVGVELTPKLTP